MEGPDCDSSDEKDGAVEGPVDENLGSDNE